MRPRLMFARGHSAMDTVLLNTQSQRFQTKRDLAQARYNVLIGGLRLREANGRLTPEDLSLINLFIVR